MLRAKSYSNLGYVKLNTCRISVVLAYATLLYAYSFFTCLLFRKSRQFSSYTYTCKSNSLASCGGFDLSLRSLVIRLTLINVEYHASSYSTYIYIYTYVHIYIISRCKYMMTDRYYIKVYIYIYLYF